VIEKPQKIRYNGYALASHFRLVSMKSALYILLVISLFAAHVQAEENSSFVVLKGHREGVQTLAFSPDGKKIVTSGAGESTSGERSVRIWDVESGKELLRLKEHIYVVKSIVFSPDGKVIVTTDHYTTRAWDADTGEELTFEWNKNQSFVSAFFSPDGKKIATTSRDGTHIWDADSGKVLHKLEGGAYAFFPDGKQIITSGSFGSMPLRIWNVETGEELRGLGSGEFSSVLVSPDGTKIVALGLRGGTLQRWDVESGEELPRINQSIEAVAFSPDSKKIVTCFYHHNPRERANLVQLWDAESGELLHTWKDHRRRINTVAFSPCGKRIAAAFSGYTVGYSYYRSPCVCIWDIDAFLDTDVLPPPEKEPDAAELEINDEAALNAPKAEDRLTFVEMKVDMKKIGSAAFTSDGKKIVVSSDNPSSTQIWDAESREKLREIDLELYYLFPGGKKMVMTPKINDGRILIGDIESGKVLELERYERSLYDFSPDERIIITSRQLPSYALQYELWNAESGEKWDIEGKRAPLFSPDGTKIIMINENADRYWISVGDAESGKVLYELKKGMNGTFSPDGKKIATANYHFTWIWDAESGEELHQLEGECGYYAGRFRGWVGGGYSPERKTFITTVNHGNGTSDTRIWDTESWEKLHQVKGDFGGLSPDGKKLITKVTPGDGKYVLHFWDAESGKELYRLENVESIGWYRFTPDGKRVMTTNREEYIAHFWDAESGKKLYSLEGSVGMMKFSPDGTKIVTEAEEEDALYVWDAESGEKLYTLEGGFSGFLQGGRHIFTPDGTKIFTTNKYGIRRVWDAGSGKELYNLGGRIVVEKNDESGRVFYRNVRGIHSFSPDGKMIVTINGSENVIHFWDIDTGKALFRLEGLLGNFSPDEKKFITVKDAAVRIWDLSSLAP